MESIDNFLDHYNRQISKLIIMCQNIYISGTSEHDFKSFLEKQINYIFVRFMLVAAASLGLITVDNNFKVHINKDVLLKNYGSTGNPINIFALFDFQLTKNYDTIVSKNSDLAELKEGLINLLWVYFDILNSKDI